MEKVSVLNGYECGHLETFRLRISDAKLVGEYLRRDDSNTGESDSEGSEKRGFLVNSIKCQECHESEPVAQGKGFTGLNTLSSLSVLQSKPDLMDWYLDMLNDCKNTDAKGAERILRIWARAVVCFFQPSSIERFFRSVSGSRDMPQKAGLSKALTNALAQKVVRERHIFWENINEAFLIDNLRPDPNRRDKTSKCTKTIKKLIWGIQDESKLMYHLTCDYPVGIPTSLVVMQAKSQMGDLDIILDDVLLAIHVALDRLGMIFGLDLDAKTAEHEAEKDIATARWLLTALYQLYARKRTLMWQVATRNGA